MITERIEIQHGGELAPDAMLFRERLIETYLSGDSADTTFRRTIIEDLFNGDLRRPGVLQHIERGCCKSALHTIVTMQRVGIRVLIPWVFRCLDRQNWTGVLDATYSYGLPASVHHFFSGVGVAGLVQQ